MDVCLSSLPIHLYIRSKFSEGLYLQGNYQYLYCSQGLRRLIICQFALGGDPPIRNYLSDFLCLLLRMDRTNGDLWHEKEVILSNASLQYEVPQPILCRSIDYSCSEWLRTYWRDFQRRIFWDYFGYPQNATDYVLDVADWLEIITPYLPDLTNYYLCYPPLPESKQSCLYRHPSRGSQLKFFCTGTHHRNQSSPTLHQRGAGVQSLSRD